MKSGVLFLSREAASPQACSEAGQGVCWDRVERGKIRESEEDENCLCPGGLKGHLPVQPVWQLHGQAGWTGRGPYNPPGPNTFSPSSHPSPPPSTRPPPVQEGLAASQVCRETSQGFAGIRWMDLVEEKTSTTEISIYIQVTNSPSY